MAITPQRARLGRAVDIRVGDELVGPDNPFPIGALAAGSEVMLKGSKATQPLTQADAVANVLTFPAPIESIEIYHDEATVQTFVVNGLSLPIAAGGWRSPVGGTPSAEVTIPASVDCVVARLV